MPLLVGGITTRRSGLRLFIAMLPPGGGGDFVGMTLPVEQSSPGDARAFTKPFPTGLVPTPFCIVRSAIIPPVLGGLCWVTGDITFLGSVAWGGESMLVSVIDVVTNEWVTRELPG